MEEDEYISSPFWHPTNPRRRNLRRSSSSLILNSGLYIIFLLVIAFCFFFIIIPSFLSFTSQIFRPHSVKKSWDSLNLVLVLFAIICGFLSRNNGENRVDYEDQSVSTRSEVHVHDQKSNPTIPHQNWYEHSDRTAYNTFGRLRSSSSYPDLRQDPSWVSDDERWRFYDDIHVKNYRFMGSESSDHIHHRERRPELEEEEYLTVKNEAPAEFLPHQEEEVEEICSPPPSSSVPASPPPRVVSPPPTLPPSVIPPPPPTPPKMVSRKPKQTYEAVGHRNNDLHLENSQPPPSALPPVFSEMEQTSSGRSEKRRGSATKEFLTSLRRRRKKQRQKSVENFEYLLGHQRPYVPTLPPRSPPPPPPPPPPSVFHNLFSSKKGKTKKVIQSVPLPSPSPSPPPPQPRVSYAAARASKSKVQTRPIKPNKPPLAAQTSSFNEGEDNVSIGSESPLLPIPPPPPPPPFKMSEWKFVVDGDYVRIKSNSNSPRGSPHLDDSDQGSPTNGGDLTRPVFCPSPDVNSKADSFIARFRAGLKMEKMNSMKGKQGIEKSNLGREPSPSPLGPEI